MSDAQLPVNAELLQWARLEAGLSREEAAQRARINALKPRGAFPGMSPSERVAAWERGDQNIALRQLEALAKTYHRPLLTFFLSVPPAKKQSFTDFRTLFSKKIIHETPEFSAFLRRIKTIHEDLVSILQKKSTERVSIDSCLKLNTPVDVAASTLRGAINFSLSEQEHLKSADYLLRALRNKIHQAGVFTLFEGNLGSHHTDISPDEFRGIAMSHPFAPLIVVNPNDAKAAQLFTIIHELTHIALGKSAISNANASTQETNQHSKIESFCNQVTSEFLIPKDILTQRTSKSRLTLPEDEIERLSKLFKTSRLAIALRLQQIDYITSQEYKELYLVYKGQWLAKKAKEKESPSGPSKNAIDRFRLGEKFINTVVSAAHDGLISLQDASRILRVKAARIPRTSG